MKDHVSIAININVNVWVRLTPEGEQVYLDHQKALGTINPTKHIARNAYGYTPFLLWEIMNIFGQSTYNGSEQMFVDNEIRMGAME